ncbi:MAG: SusC/RagA family TonB-linked outer membrane protein, partial [Bacteroidales bacterium]|nr:SusC/RagA family TonB-linked outer membrane protein [Bacteroidales bacterium]
MKRITSILVCLAFIGLSALAQDMQITGKVTSLDDGSALPGVSVVIKGTQSGIATEADGSYSITAPTDAVLVFTFVGMADQEVSVNGRTIINVEMTSSDKQLDEVVVTAYGITREKKALGYSATEINSDEFLQKSENDLVRSLDGKVAGVEVRSSGGAIGSAARITIRGNTSFSGDNQPMIVVDGIPYSNDFISTTNMSTSGAAYGSGLGTLDPNDIQSTTVLKGAAAAALYGSRAKNGVILITTKSGAISKKGFSVTVNSSVNFEEIASLPEYQNTYGTGSEFNYSNANGSWGPAFADLDSIPTWPGYVDAFGWDDMIAYEAQPDNVANLFQTGVSFDNSVNISGTKEATSYNLTVSDSRNKGYIPHSSFTRSSLSVGGSTMLWDKLTARASLSYAQTNQIGSIFGNNQSSDGYAASSFARALWLGRTWIMDPYENPVTGTPMQPNGAQFDNPLWSWKHNQVMTDMSRITGKVNLGYELTDWLNLSYSFGFNSFGQDRAEIIDIGSRAVTFGGDGGITNDVYSSTEIESQLFLNFDKKFGDIQLTGLIGLNNNQRQTNRQLYRGYTYIVPGIYDIDNTEDVVALGGGTSLRRLMGLMAEATLSYGNYAFVTVRARNDKSSTLPVENNSYFYPAVDASFIFTDAFNMKSNLLSFGKIRASWGKVGMDADPYLISTVYGIGTPFMGQPYLYTPDMATDPGLSPEFKQDMEVGAELNFFNNRVKVDFAYYNSISTDMIYPVYVPTSSGYTTQVTNVGELENNGIELALDAKIVDASNFQWNARLTYTRNRNVINDINGVDSLVYISQLFGDPASAIIVGEPYGVLYGSMAARDDDGNFLIDPSTGLIIEAAEQGIVGDPNPDFQMGFANTFSLYGVSLSVLFDLKYGGDIYSNSIVSMLGRGVTMDTEDRMKSVIIPGVYGNSSTVEPILDGEGNAIPNTTQISYNDQYFCSGFSSFAINSYSEFQVYDATTFRLRELALGYELPKSILANIPITGLNISFSARNLWFWTPNIPQYLNFDPEVSTYGATNVLGVEYSGAPSTKRYGFNVRITF